MWHLVTPRPGVRRGNQLREDQPSVPGCTAGRVSRSPHLQTLGPGPGEGRVLRQFTREAPGGSGSWGNGAQARPKQDLDREGGEGRKRGWEEWSRSPPTASTGQGAAASPVPCGLPKAELRNPPGQRTPSQAAMSASGFHHLPLRDQRSHPGALPSTGASSPPPEAKTVHQRPKSSAPPRRAPSLGRRTQMSL